MKQKLHPEYIETTIACSCGNVIHTRSTQKNIHVEVCSQCHPFFTGKETSTRIAGRIEKFQKKYGKKGKK